MREEIEGSSPDFMDSMLLLREEMSVMLIVFFRRSSLLVLGWG